MEPVPPQAPSSIFSKLGPWEKYHLLSFCSSILDEDGQTALAEEVREKTSFLAENAHTNPLRAWRLEIHGQGKLHPEGEIVFGPMTIATTDSTFSDRGSDDDFPRRYSFTSSESSAFAEFRDLEESSTIPLSRKRPNLSRRESTVSRTKSLLSSASLRKFLNDAAPARKRSTDTTPVTSPRLYKSSSTLHTRKRTSTCEDINGSSSGPASSRRKSRSPPNKSPVPSMLISSGILSLGDILPTMSLSPRDEAPSSPTGKEELGEKTARERRKERSKKVRSMLGEFTGLQQETEDETQAMNSSRSDWPNFVQKVLLHSESSGKYDDVDMFMIMTPYEQLVKRFNRSEDVAVEQKFSSEDEKALRNCFLEIVNSEKNYVIDLSKLVQLRVRLLVGNVIRPRQAKILFAGVKTLYLVHKQIIEMFEIQEVLCLANAFAGLLEDEVLNVYQKYRRNYEKASTLHHKLKESNQQYREILGRRRIELDGLLLSPIQRIAKYPLLFKELLKSAGKEGNARVEKKMSVFLEGLQIALEVVDMK